MNLSNLKVSLSTLSLTEAYDLIEKIRQSRVFKKFIPKETKAKPVNNKLDELYILIGQLSQKEREELLKGV